MKAISKYILCSLVVLLGLTACDKNDECTLDLTGNCLIEEIALDGFAGTIDLATRSIVVRLPEGTPCNAMKVTSLKLSDGATADIAQGQVLNMEEAQAIRVRMNDLYMDWNISVLHDEARILSFVANDIYTGIIDEPSKTITVYVPGSVDVKSIVPTIEYSANATISPLSGVATDFTEPVTYTVKNNTAESRYVVTVIAIGHPKAVFVGAVSDMSKLDPEAGAACAWMLANVPESMYASFADIQSEQIDLSECRIIWWHYHKDGGVDGHDAFVANAPEALAAKNQLRTFYENGGALLLTRYATNLPSFIGVTGDDEWTTPNNCWGQNEDGAELCGGPWSFRIWDGQNGHPLWQNLIAGDNAQEVYCTDAGYHITNSTAQYHIGTDWGGYDNHAAWEARTGGRILGVGGDGAVVAWEYPAHDGRGGIICIGSGCYDWYSYTFEAGYVENFHKNIAKITQNAFNYLTK